MDKNKKAAELFPTQYDQGKCDDMEEQYNSSHELPIPRQFFGEEDFDYQSANVNKLLSDFISSLDYQNSEFLCKQDKMTQEGLIGTSYKYENQYNKYNYANYT